MDRVRQLLQHRHKWVPVGSGSKPTPAYRASAEFFRRPMEDRPSWAFDHYIILACGCGLAKWRKYSLNALT